MQFIPIGFTFPVHDDIARCPCPMSTTRPFVAWIVQTIECYTCRAQPQGKSVYSRGAHGRIYSEKKVDFNRAIIHRLIEIGCNGFFSIRVAISSTLANKLKSVVSFIHIVQSADFNTTLGNGTRFRSRDLNGCESFLRLTQSKVLFFYFNAGGLWSMYYIFHRRVGCWRLFTRIKGHLIDFCVTYFICKCNKTLF